MRLFDDNIMTECRVGICCRRTNFFSGHGPTACSLDGQRVYLGIL